MAVTTTKPAQQSGARPAPPPLKPATPAGQNAVAVIKPPRLAFPTEFEKKYEIDLDKWRTLTDAVFPGAKTIEAVGMALAYCRERKLDIFKRPVHIVSVYSTALNKQVETVWPGINELRTTAQRTKNFAGMDAPVYGPMLEHTFAGGRISYWENGAQNWKEDPGITLRFPEWMQLTVYRTLQGNRVPFPGPRVFWLETYATKGRLTDNPNAMWEKRPGGQLDKCCEAAALRRAFPEEIGDDYVPEEIGAFHTHQAIDVTEDGSATVGAAEPNPEDFRKPAEEIKPAAPGATTADPATPPKTARSPVAGAPAERLTSETAKPQDPPHDRETGEIKEPEKKPNVTDVEELADLDENPAPAATPAKPATANSALDDDPEEQQDDPNWPPEHAKPGEKLYFSVFGKPSEFGAFAEDFLPKTNPLGAQQFLDFYKDLIESFEKSPQQARKDFAAWVRTTAKEVIAPPPKKGK